MSRELEIHGRIINQTQPDTTLPFEMDLTYEFKLLPPIERTGYMHTENGGFFHEAIVVSDEEFEALSNGAAWRLDIWFDVPPGVWSFGEIFWELSPEEVCNKVQQRIGDIRINVDLSEFSLKPIHLVVNEVPQLDNVDPLDFIFWNDSSTRVCGRALAHRSVTTHNVTYNTSLFYRSRDFEQDYWLQVSIPNESVIFRTRIQTSRTPIEDGYALMVTGMEDTVRRDAIDQLEDQYRDGIIVRDMGLRFVDGHITVHGRAGCGTDRFMQFFEIGTFTVSYDLSFIMREREPFREEEFNNLFDLKQLLFSFDIYPGTDIDERCRIIGMPVERVEELIVSAVQEEVRRSALAQLALRVRGVVDSEFNRLTQPLLQNFPTDGEAFAQVLRQTLFFQPNELSIKGQDLIMTGFAGLWHWAVSLQSSTCAASTVAIMYPQLKLMPVFRRYEKTLMQANAKKYIHLYERHQEELSAIVMRDPSLAGKIARLAIDLQPVLSSTAKAVLSKDAIRRIHNVLELCVQHASIGLKSDIKLLKKHLLAVEGSALRDIVRLPVYKRFKE